MNKVGDDALLTNLETGAVHALNRTAFDVWRRCDGMTPPHEIAKHLAAHYEVALDVLVRDVISILMDFASLNLTVNQGYRTSHSIVQVGESE